MQVERLEWRALLATVYFENFESGDGGYVADNTGGSVLGLWHYSIGRRHDGLPNHSPDHNWYYGMFETSTGGGRYDVLPFDHQGTLKSPAIQLPACGATTLAFNYILNTRPELDRDFAEVFVIGESGSTLILSRQDGSLPQSGYDQWLTAHADLSAFSGEQIMLLFSFRTGTPPLVDPEGWYVDDVLITSEPNSCQPASLSVAKDVDDATPNELQTITYTITATNAADSPAMATGVTVTDNLPPGVTYVSSTATEGAYDPNTDLWSGLQLAPGETQTLSVVATVNAGTAGQTLTNTAVIDAENADPSSDPAVITVNSVDLSVSKTASDLTPSEQQTVSYTITATNSASSNAAATGVEVEDNLPPGVTFVSAIASAGAYDPATDLWTGFVLPPGESATLTIEVMVNAGTAGLCLHNEAIIRGNETDPSASNDQSSVDLCVNAQAVDLSVTKTIDDATPAEGQLIAYTITVANAAASTSAAVGVVVSDSLPVGVTFVSATASEGTYDSVNDVWTGLDLAPGETRTLTIFATVNAGTAGQVLTNSAIVTGPGPGSDPDPDDNEATAIAVVDSVVQFITPMSVHRLAGPFAPPAPAPTDPPAAGTATIKGFKWHDLDQDGVWDAGEPARPGWSVFIDLNGDNLFDPQTEQLAVTATDGSYVFEDLAPGTYFVREDRAELSAGTFQVQQFPAADPGGQRDADEHRITVVAGQVVEGQFGVAEAPNFGSFDYSPLVRPADDSLQRFAVLAESEQQTFLTASHPWQSFSISNTTGRPLRITAINKLIDTSLVPADQFVTVFQRATDGTLTVPTFPIDVAAGESIEFFAFYEPVIRAGDIVTAQFPDWFDDPSTASVNESRTRPPHTFSLTDRLEIVTEFTDAAPAAGPTFAAYLVGASTYDSDIFYDGAVDFLDLGRLSDDLLVLPAGSPLDPTSDINVRHPNGAGQIVGTSAWPASGPPAREIGYGDFGPLNVEMLRRRAPFLDLDPDNSSGGQGAGFAAEVAAGSAPIADADARFANRPELLLTSVQLTISNPLDGALEDISFSGLPTGIAGQSQFSGGVRVLTLTGPASLETYIQALQSLQYINSDPTPTPGTRQIQIRATGGDDFVFRDSAQQVIFDQSTGNVALALVTVMPSQASPIAPPDMNEAEGESNDLLRAAIAPQGDWTMRHGSCDPPSQEDAGAATQGQPHALQLATPSPEYSGLVRQALSGKSAERTAIQASSAVIQSPANISLAEQMLALVCDEEARARDQLFAQLAEDDLDLLAAPE